MPTINRRIVFLVIIALIVVLFLSSLHPASPTSRLHEYLPFNGNTVQEPPFKHTRVFVASAFEAHFDVYLVFAGIVQHLLASKLQPDQYSLHVYAFLPMRYKFHEVIEAQTGLYNHNVIHNEYFVEDFKKAFQNDFTPTLLVLGTCEIDMPAWSAPLLELWDSLPNHKKFEVVCGIHNVGDNHWYQNQLPEWARRGVIRTYAISEHVSRSFHKKLLGMADSSTPAYYTSDLSHVKTDYIAPVLDLSPTFLGKHSSGDRPLSNVVIQGSFELARRDYTSIFAELETSLRQDASVWGYNPATNSAPFEPIETHSPLVLHIIGNGREEDLKIPPALRNVVKVWKNLDYPDYYRKVASMDLMLPAFSGMGYYESSASSSVAMAVQCNTPILGTQQLIAAYTYANSSSSDFIVTRPSALREVHALLLLRTRKLPESYWTEDTKPPSGFSVTSPSEKWILPIPPRYRAPELWDEMDAMLNVDRSWRKNLDSVQRAKLAIWQRNEETVTKILRAV